MEYMIWAGGAYEYVAAYVNNENGNLSQYGSTLVNGESYTKDVYTSNGDTAQGNYNASASKYGDAVYETSNNYMNSNSWYSQRSYFPYLNFPLFVRGGECNNWSDAGLFYFKYYDGVTITIYYVGFRPVLVTL